MIGFVEIDEIFDNIESIVADAGLVANRGNIDANNHKCVDLMTIFYHFLDVTAFLDHGWKIDDNFAVGADNIKRKVKN